MTDSTAPFKIGVRDRFKATGKVIPNPPPRPTVSRESTKINTFVVPGDRIECVTCTDEHDPIRPGTRGTVSTVYQGAGDTIVYVDWDNGRKLGLVADAGDQYRQVEIPVADAGDQYRQVEIPMDGGRVFRCTRCQWVAPHASTILTGTYKHCPATKAGHRWEVA